MGQATRQKIRGDITIRLAETKVGRSSLWEYELVDARGVMAWGGYGMGSTRRGVTLAARWHRWRLRHYGHPVVGKRSEWQKI